MVPWCAIVVAASLVVVGEAVPSMSAIGDTGSNDNVVVDVSKNAEQAPPPPASATTAAATTPPPPPPPASATIAAATTLPPPPPPASATGSPVVASESQGAIQRPICQDQDQHPFASSSQDINECTSGYESITNVTECVKAAQYLGVTPDDTNGDQMSVPLSDTAGMKDWVEQRVIKSDDPKGLHKPYGCYADRSRRVVADKAKYVMTVWINLNKGGRKHDNSAPMCKRICELASSTSTLPTTTTIATTTPLTTTIAITTPLTTTLTIAPAKKAGGVVIIPPTHVTLTETRAPADGVVREVDGVAEVTTTTAPESEQDYFGQAKWIILLMLLLLCCICAFNLGAFQHCCKDSKHNPTYVQIQSGEHPHLKWQKSDPRHGFFLRSA